MTILNPPFQEFPKTDHQVYVQALATTQMQQPVGNAIIAAYGSVRDYIAELYRQSVKAKLINLAPPDALTQIGSERGMPQGPQESTAAYASRLLNAFNTWPWAGTAYGLLQALYSTGYQNVVLAQVTGGKQYTLDNGGTNLLPFSQAFDRWISRFGATITANTTVAPDGTTTAQTFTEDNPPSAPTLNSLTPAITGGTIASGTVFVKVSALNGTVEGLPSNELSVAVTGPTASIVAAWSAPGSGPAPTGYRIYVGTAAGAEGQVFIAGNVTSVTIVTLVGSAATPLVTTAIEHRIQDQTSPVESVGELRRYSVWVKANTLSNIDFYVNGDSAFGINFNLVTGVIPAAVAVTAPLASGVLTSSLWPGWYRIWFVKRVGVVGASGLRIQGADTSYTLSYTGTGRSFFLWGAQCEIVSDLTAPTLYTQTLNSSKPTTQPARTLLVSTMANGIWETDALSTLVPPTQSFWSKFDVIFPLPLQAPSFLWAGGIPASNSMEANFIRAIIQAWKPAHATVNRIIIQQQGKVLGYPATNVLGASNGVLGGTSTVWTP